MSIFRTLAITLLSLALLLRSAAGLAMQVEMAYTAASAAPTAMPSCHTPEMGATLDAAKAPTAQKASADANSDTKTTACALCCLAAALPADWYFNLSSSQYSAPIAALFHNLPAPAQRPTKPPLV